MFTLATCNDLIRLKSRFPHLVFPEEHAWGLKQFGSLFCYEQLEESHSTTVLEVGAGRSRFFDQHIGPSHEYWMLDAAGFYNGDSFQRSLDLRKNTRFVSGKLGDFIEELKNGFFDFVFSISVLEHIPAEVFEDCCRDMFRLVKPGGKAVHTMDLNSLECTDRAQSIFEAFQTAGFQFDEPLQIDWDFLANRPILTEPLHLVANYYHRGNKTLWLNNHPIHHTGSVAIVCKRPDN